MQARSESLIAKLLAVFQTNGFEGASLSKLTEATGLIKASLYHRFPGGKEEIAQAVLQDVDRQFAEYVLKPVFEPGTPADRLAQVAARLAKFYGNGKRACLLEKLSVGGEPAALRAHVRQTLEFWVGAFARLAEESGVAPEAARQRASDAIGAIEGALVVTRITGENGPFLRAVESLGERLGIG